MHFLGGTGCVCFCLVGGEWVWFSPPSNLLIFVHFASRVCKQIVGLGVQKSAFTEQETESGSTFRRARHSCLELPKWTARIPKLRKW